MRPLKEDTFVNCRCPSCKRPFDFVPISFGECPFCKKEFTEEAVWQTRRDPNVIMLPGWVTAFGWPVLLMALGVGFFFYQRMYGFVSFKIPAAFIAIGAVFFCVKISTNGEY